MNKSSKLALLPVVLTFFAMGFVDLVGIASNYVKADLGLSDSGGQLPALAGLLRFLILLGAFEHADE